MSCAKCSVDVNCTCTNTGCSAWGDCRQCVPKHRDHGEIPGCFFTEAGEKTYDRSLQNFLQDHSCSEK